MNKLEVTINDLDKLTDRELEVILTYSCARLKKKIEVPIIKKYEVEFNGKKYKCNKLSEIAKITGKSTQTINRIFFKSLKYTTIRSKGLENIKITQLYKKKEDLKKLNNL